ncbi:C40 family peptidase [Streptomyces sp. CB03911]|uniref:C40 family peptidase n=1 Tax=Streptomyces sp. CB03911 TaxID=1804758 RepID=UPI00093FA4B5|nr:C40 family peptidase [Streptomyces sp. CB03911]OKI25055.1 hypothetical protein A6A07_31130 [Streptomyces sp. CB03911]
MSVRTSKLRAAVLAAAITISGTATTAVFTAGSAQAASSVGGQISRSEVLARANDWYTRNVQYSQSASATDVGGRYYRTDCSGFVSMAWHLSDSPNTDGLDVRSLTTRVALTDLQPGDALDNDPHDGYSPDSAHIVLFDHWIDKASGYFAFIAEANTVNDMVKSTAHINSGNIGGHPASGYFGLRYNNIVGDVQAPPPAAPKPALGNKASVIGADGNQMTFTRDAGSGHLQVTYLPVGGSWATADLTAMTSGGVSGGGAPAAFVQPNGTIGAITADAANGHLRVTFKPANGAWQSSDLTSDFGAPVSDGDVSTQIDGSGTLAVFTRNSVTGRPSLTYQPASGGWNNFDLASAGAQVSGGGAPAAFLQPNGTLGVVTADAANGHLRVTFKPANGAWQSSDLTSDFGAPVSDGQIGAIVDGSGTLALFTRNSLNGRPNMTYQPSSGGWSNFDLTGVGAGVSAGGAPAPFLQQNGTLGVATADAADGHLRITYKSATGPWATSDLSQDFGADTSDGNIASVVGNDGTLSIYSRNADTGHLNLTYQPASGGWGHTDMFYQVGTPSLG